LSVNQLWEIAGCICDSSGTRYFRDVFELPSGVKVISASSDFSRNNATDSDPNLSKLEAKNKNLPDLIPLKSKFNAVPLFASFAIGTFALATGYYWILILLGIVIIGRVIQIIIFFALRKLRVVSF